jgi:serine/threonine protein kinase
LSASTSSSSPSPPLTPPVTEPASELDSEAPTKAPAKPEVGDLAGQGVTFGEAHYVLGKLLGVGGMGEVYLARRVVDAGGVQWNTADLAAIKVVRRDVAAYFGEDLKDFADEARLHRYLNHPNVVPVRDVTQVEGTLYVLMEYLEGHDLRLLLKVAESLETRLSDAAVCNILAQVADALDYVHRATDESGKPLHIVHRDVSPSNIRVTAAGVVKLMDFGVAKHDADWREKTRSSWGGFKGKLMYLSPEQASHEPLDGRADLFALGCIMVECLTGRRLFDGNPEPLIAPAIQAVTPEDVEKALQGMEEGLKAICHKLLARNREERYGTGKEVAVALRSWAFVEKRYMLDSGTLAREVAELLESEAEESTPPPLEPHSSNHSRHGAARPPRRRLAVAALILFIAACSVAAVLAAVYFLRPPPPPAPPVERIPSPMSSPSPSPTEAVPVLQESKPLALAKKPLSSVAKCVGVTMAGALAAACPPVHVATHSRAGDCTMQAPPRDFEGHKIPEFFPVHFVSLNGQKCKGQPPAPGFRCEEDSHCCPPSVPVCFSEPCPAGDGELVMMSNGRKAPGVPIPEQFFQGALFYGKARVEPELAVIREVAIHRPLRSFTGRTVALFTEMRLKNGTTVPICGVLYQGYLESPPPGTLAYGEKLPGLNKEGVPVLDPKYYGRPATPTDIPYIQLFWP